MKLRLFDSYKRWKDSLIVSLAIMTGIQSIITAFDLNNLWQWEEIAWWIRLIITFGLFIAILCSTFYIKFLLTKKGIKKTINDNIIFVKKQDIFSFDGLKLIPFNEFFDTIVDDHIIAHNSLNGIFIDKHVNDISELKQNIENYGSQSVTLRPRIKNNRNCFPLGKIIKFNDYLLLSFTHFLNNEAHLSHSDFEKCIFTMWKEIERVYANLPVAIPLLGSGITRFDDTPHKSEEELIKCLLCTLKMSNVHIKQPITICLTDKIFNNINLYEL